jgi:hypothetical protein
VEINLDAYEAARKEARGEVAEPHTVRFRGVVFPMVVQEKPWALAEGLAFAKHERIIVGLHRLLGDRWDEFDALGPSEEDIVAFATAAAGLFGMESLGESAASGSSSSSTSAHSRPTSNGSTRSTSRKRSGAPTPSPSASSTPSSPTSPSTQP